MSSKKLTTEQALRIILSESEDENGEASDYGNDSDFDSEGWIDWSRTGLEPHWTGSDRQEITTCYPPISERRLAVRVQLRYNRYSSVKMIVYKDIITGDELFTDAHNPQLIDDFFYHVEGKWVNESNEVDESKFGANPSEEEAGEQLEVATKKVINIVSHQRLTETFFPSKKEYTVYLKNYMKGLKKKFMDDDKEAEAEAFQEKAKQRVNELLKSFKDYQFFMGESQNEDGHIALMNFREDGLTPFFIFFKDGLLAEKF
ncbi:hypothetical protein ScPMuIL_017493 [Solemya velum]